MSTGELIKEASLLVNPTSIDNAEMGSVACMLITDQNNCCCAEKSENVIILTPYGRCRGFMYQTNKANIDTNVILDKNKIVELGDLFPYSD